MQRKIKVFFVEANGVKVPYVSKLQAEKAQEELEKFGIETKITDETRTIKLNI